ADSLLAQAGFELFVPLGISASTSWWSRAWKSRGTPEEGLSVAGPPLIGDRGFESVSLQRRVRCELVAARLRAVRRWLRLFCRKHPAMRIWQGLDCRPQLIDQRCTVAELSSLLDTRQSIRPSPCGGYGRENRRRRASTQPGRCARSLPKAS